MRFTTCLLAGAFVVTAMGTDLPPVGGDGSAPLAEIFIVVERGVGKSPGDLVFEVYLKNISSVPMRVEYKRHEFQYLDFEVEDERGKRVATNPYASIFSLISFDPLSYEIQPARVRTQRVNLDAIFRAVPTPPRGIYTVRAVWTYPAASMKVVSDPVRVRIGPSIEEGNDGDGSVKERGKG